MSATRSRRSGCDIIREMWTAEEPFDFEGRYYKVEGASAAPIRCRSPTP